MQIETILRKHARPESLLAAEPVKKALLADLRAHKRLNSRIYAVLFGFECALGVLAIAALFTDLVHGTNARETILGAAGIGIPATLVAIQRVVREWSNSNLLITIIGHSDESAVQALIEKLLTVTPFAPDEPPSRKAASRRAARQNY